VVPSHWPTGGPITLASDIRRSGPPPDPRALGEQPADRTPTWPSAVGQLPFPGHPDRQVTELPALEETIGCRRSRLDKVSTSYRWRHHGNSRRCPGSQTTGRSHRSRGGSNIGREQSNFCQRNNSGGSEARHPHNRRSRQHPAAQIARGRIDSLSENLHFAEQMAAPRSPLNGLSRTSVVHISMIPEGNILRGSTAIATNDSLRQAGMRRRRNVWGVLCSGDYRLCVAGRTDDWREVR
jgi:hypothetical protein